MKQVLQNMKSGQVEVREVPVPSLRAGGLLVQTEVSLISTGTERRTVETSQKSLLGKAASRPDLVRKVLGIASRQGLGSAFKVVRDRLDEWLPLGYSSVGRVVDPGDCLNEFKPGDRVACAGLGFASHAEMVFVPRNLCVRVPDGVEPESACFTTLAAIALQGVRQAETVLGEVVLVTGLGLVGLLTVDLLKAAGARVIGLDLQDARLEQARERGADYAAHPDDPHLDGAVSRLTGGLGVDQALVTTATDSSRPLLDAAKHLRDRGRLVIVGNVGIKVPRAPFYEKEIDVRFSRSYGPGRYDVEYEEKGHDYPPGYVRWTERRNMQAVLTLMADGQLCARKLISHRHSIDEAPQAYQLLTRGAERALAIILAYDQSRRADPLELNQKPLTRKAPDAASCRVGWIGIGNFARSSLLPHFKEVEGVELRRAASSSGTSAARAVERYGFCGSAATTEEILKDSSVNTVVITTRHDSHASLVKQAIEAGKENIFVEKPLAIRESDLEEVSAALSQSQIRFMLGYNRRFAPAIRRALQELEDRQHPCIIRYSVNAGYLPPDHWSQDPHQGGGRLLGEACHFTDLLMHLAGSAPAEVLAACLRDPAGKYVGEDNFSAIFSFQDGSLATLNYFSNGSERIPKERLEISTGGTVLSMNDFTRLDRWTRRRKTLWKGRQDKGHRHEIKAFLDSIVGGKPSPIPLSEILIGARLPFLIRESLRLGRPVKVESLD